MYGSDAGQPVPSLYTKGPFVITKGGSPTCIKSTGDKIGIPEGWVIYWLGNGATSYFHSEDIPTQALYCCRGPPHKFS